MIGLQSFRSPKTVLRSWQSILLGAMIILALGWGDAAEASVKRALVIGNAAYTNVSPLSNPTNDAQDIAAVLEDVGFAVDHRTDLTQLELMRALQDFQRKALDAEVALIYYAGHGIEVDRHNYLIPTDADLRTDRDINYQTVPLDLAVQAVEGAGRLGVVIVDACRNNPFLQQMTRTTRAIGRGLAAVEPEGNVLVAYAAKEGTLALDGDGRNSPYAEALIETLREPGVEVGRVFRLIRDRVVAATNGQQEPFLYGSLSAEDFYLNSPPIAETAVVAEPVPEAQSAVSGGGNELEATYWRLCEKRDTLAYCQAYLDAFPQGPRAPLARLRVSELQANALAAPEPSAEPRPGPAAATPEPDTKGASVATAAPAPGDAERNHTDAASGAWAVLQESWNIRALREFKTVFRDAEQAAQADRRIAFLIARQREAQAELNRLGYDAGPADGVWGPRSRRALVAFQREHGMPEDGVLSGDLLATLQSAAPMETGRGGGEGGIAALRQELATFNSSIAGRWSADPSSCALTYVRLELTFAGLRIWGIGDTGQPEEEFFPFDENLSKLARASRRAEGGFTIYNDVKSELRVSPTIVSGQDFDTGEGFAIGLVGPALQILSSDGPPINLFRCGG